MNTRQIVISEDLKSYEFLQGLLNLSNVQIWTVEQIRQNFKSVKFVFLTEQNLETLSKSFFEKIDKFKETHIVLLTQGTRTDESIRWLLECDSIKHLISIESSRAEHDLQRILDETSVLVSFSNLQLRDKISLSISTTSERDQVFEQIGHYANSLNSFSEFSQIIQTVTSELLNNAFYDATNTFPGKNRPDFQLQDDSQIDIEYGRDNDDYLWIFVKDPFGTLDRSSVIKSIHRVMTQKTARLDSERGAGLGLAMLFKWCSSLHFVVSKGQYTVVACALKIAKRNREFQSEKSSLHIFTD